ncbi:hypothetical protein SD71_21315 [Cohnella kolymensis]|uniref:PepSY domain-containing protein n=1 Tax=Cohnella kolymensis TaxID=1590652 RepID=A0ABR4ZZI1_9BACL|nr:PepSY domain-containing protein [Cohnella kolymensis]KIL34201.1 hypothetical protein SD71_21315 [Cohnella kolymensis]
MTKRWRWITGIVVPAAAIIIIGLAWKPWITNADALTREAAEDAVLQLYPGEVAGTKLSKGIYSMLLKTEKGLYDMKVDARSGEIVSLKRLDAFAGIEQAEPVEANPSTPTAQIPASEPSPDNAPTQQKPNIDLPPEPTPGDPPPKRLAQSSSRSRMTRSSRLRRTTLLRNRPQRC